MFTKPKHTIKRWYGKKNYFLLLLLFTRFPSKQRIYLPFGFLSANESCTYPQLTLHAPFYVRKRIKFTSNYLFSSV